MSGNFAIKGGGGRAPNGKCHLKFPFWFFDSVPYTSTSLGLWGSLGGAEEVLLASTIIHSLAAPFYMFCIFNICLGYTCIFAQPSGDGVGVGRIVFSILLLLVLDLSGAVFSGMLYNNVPAAKNNTTAFWLCSGLFLILTRVNSLFE